MSILDYLPERHIAEAARHRALGGLAWSGYPLHPNADDSATREWRATIS
jgi:hypothetical protein